MSEEKALKEFQEIIDSRDVESLLVRANEKISKSLKEKGLDPLDADLFEILEEGVKSKQKKSMYIVDASIGKQGVGGYAIQYEGRDGELEVESAYFIEDGKVSTGMIGKLREMAYMDYELRQGRERDIVKVFEGIDL